MKKWYAVEFAGYWHIQDSEMYEGNDVMNSDDVGSEPAERNAKLAASAPELQTRVKELEAENQRLTAEVERLREALKPLAYLDLTGHNGGNDGIVYQRDNTKILRRDVVKAYELLNP